MTRTVTSTACVLALIIAAQFSATTVNAASPGETAVAQAAQNNQFAYIMFYKANDNASQQMHATLTKALSEREDATIIPIHLGDQQEASLIKQFDATRLPMPAVAALAPNGAVCSVLPRKVSEQQVLACIVSPIQATCLKTLQDNKLVALCVLPSPRTSIPEGVTNFKQNKHFTERTQVIPVLAGDQREAKFLKQLNVPTDKTTPVVAFIAPPGVMVGMFDEQVTANELAQQLAAAGRCCEDENCKHNQSARKATSTRR